MKKSLFSLMLLSPVTASAGYIDYEMLDAGTYEFAGQMGTLDIDASAEGSFGKADVTASESALAIGLKGGVSRDINFAVSVFPAGESEVEMELADIGWTGKSESEGPGDMKAGLRFRLGNGNSYPVFAVGATLPTGDDKEAATEIRNDSGVVVEPGEVGGRGSGRTDYSIGYGYFLDSGSNKLFLGAGYKATGKKDGVDYGDETTFLGQGSFSVTRSVSLVGELSFVMTGDTTDDTGHEETDPLVSLEIGGMYSLSNTTDLIGTILMLSGGDTTTYDNAGIVDTTFTIDSATGILVGLRSRF